MAAGIIAAFVAYGFAALAFAPRPRTVGTGLFAEVVFTFGLVSVMLNVATAKSQVNFNESLPKILTIFQDQNQFFGFAIGFYVVAAIYACSPISGLYFLNNSTSYMISRRSLLFDQM